MGLGKPSQTWKSCLPTIISQAPLVEAKWQAWEERVLGRGIQMEALGRDTLPPDSGTWPESLVQYTLIKYPQILCWLLLREQGHGCGPQGTYGACVWLPTVRFVRSDMVTSKGKTMGDFLGMSWEIPYELKTLSVATMPSRQFYVFTVFMWLWNYSKMKSLLKFSYNPTKPHM